MPLINIDKTEISNDGERLHQCVCVLNVLNETSSRETHVAPPAASNVSS